MDLKLLLGLVLITQISFSQKKVNDLKKMNLKGEISSITILEEKTPTVSDGGSFNSRKENNFYVFNKEGFITEEKCVVNGRFYSKKRKEYNALGQLSKVQEYDSEEVFDKDKFFEYKYDKNGEVNSLSYASSPTIYRTEVAKKGNLISYTKYELKEDKTEEKKYVRIEDLNGKVLEEDSFIRNELYSKTVNSYNNKGLLSKTSYLEYWNGRTSGNGKEFEYNLNNDITKITNLDSNNNVLDTEEVTYEYDKKGNWIKKNLRGSETIITERKIVYKI